MPCPSGYATASYTNGSYCGSSSCSSTQPIYKTQYWITYTCVKTTTGEVTTTTDYSTSPNSCCTK